MNGGANAADLVNRFGGADQFSAAHNFFSENFFSDSERLQMMTDEMAYQFSQLGLTVPETVQGFRDLVMSQNLTTEAGRELYSTLLGLAPAYDDMLELQEQATSGILSTIQQGLDSLNGVKRETAKNVVSEAIRAGVAVEDQFKRAVGVLGNLDPSLFESREAFRREQAQSRFLLNTAYGAFGGESAQVVAGPSVAPATIQVVNSQDGAINDRLGLLVDKVKELSTSIDAIKVIQKRWDNQGLPKERAV